MDSETFTGYVSPETNTTMWNVLAIVSAFVLSAAACYIVCYILRIIYNSRDVDELGIQLEPLERSGSHQSKQTINSTMIDTESDIEYHENT